MKNNKVIAVVGATASGKSAYAVDLAEKIGGEIISADSRLVYKGMNIGTAKPAIDEMRGIPHYMIDIVEPDINYSAGLYAKEAKKHVKDILSRGKTPVIAGGTGLYFRILLENCRETFDCIILDTPPLGSVADALNISKYCDGTVLVVRSGFTKKKFVNESVQALRRAGSPLLGIVLNRVDTGKKGSSYYYKDYYKYGAYYYKGKKGKHK